MSLSRMFNAATLCRAAVKTLGDTVTTIGLLDTGLVLFNAKASGLSPELAVTGLILTGLITIGGVLINHTTDAQELRLKY